jgi:hypothetical protein
VESDSVFDELEDEEQFWDPELLLPERMTSERLREEHYDFLRAAGAIFPPQPTVNGNGLVNSGHLIGTPLLSQSTDAQPSNSQSSLMGSQLPGYPTSSPLSFHGSRNQTLHGTNLLFPGAVPFNLWTHQPMPTAHINGLGHSEENCVPVLSPGLPDDQMATKALRKHVRPDAIDDVIGRTSVHLNGWLHDDNAEGPEELLKRSTKFERNMEVRLRDPLLQDSDGYMANHLQEASDLKQAEELMDSFLHDPDEDMDNQYEEAFHDDLEGHLDES